MSQLTNVGGPLCSEGHFPDAVCLDSVLAEPEETFELVIASTAPTAGLWDRRPACAAGDMRIRLPRIWKNLGAANSLNLLVDEARQRTLASTLPFLYLFECPAAWDGIALTPGGGQRCRTPR